MTIGKRIKLKRKEMGYTQKQLAILCGVATGTIQQYELGKRQPRFEQVMKIAEILNTTALELYEGPEVIAQMEESVKKSEFSISPGEPEHELIEYFWSLNYTGKDVALERIKELTEIPRYTEDDSEE